LQQVAKANNVVLEAPKSKAATINIQMQAANVNQREGNAPREEGRLKFETSSDEITSMDSLEQVFIRESAIFDQMMRTGTLIDTQGEEYVK